MLWCYGADGKLDPLYGKAREASFAQRAKMDFNKRKKITSHRPLQHKSLFPSGSKSPLTKIHPIDSWFSTPCMLYSQFGDQLTYCNENRCRQYFIDDASYSKLYLVAACLGLEFYSNP